MVLPILQSNYFTLTSATNIPSNEAKKIVYTLCQFYREVILNRKMLGGNCVCIYWRKPLSRGVVMEGTLYLKLYWGT